MYYQPSESLSWVLGVDFLDRDDVKLLPVAGAVLLLVPTSLEAPELPHVSLQELGRLLASSYAIALVILGLLVGATVIGGLTLVKVERERKPDGATQ
jgi:hypothetical protein